MLSSVTGTQTKFAPQTATDTMMKNGTQKDITTKLMCVTAMPNYSTKSIEELRVEDYAANRKFPVAGSTGGGMFGSTGTSSLFGATSTTPASSSIFGNTAQKPSLFGNTATPSATGSIFGNQAVSQPSGSMFGSTATSQPSTGMFGSTSTAAAGSSLFGSPAQAKPSLFGNTASSTPATGSLFGTAQPAQQQSTGIFGGTGFGSTTAQQPSIFGGQTQQKPLFGGATSVTPAASGSIFGSTPQTGSIFGSQPAAQPASGGIFGTTTSTAQPSTGIFGQTSTTQTGSIFGSTTTQAKPSLFGPTTGAPVATGSMFGNTQSTVAQPAAGGLFGGGFGQQQQQSALMVQPQQSALIPAQQTIVLGGDSSEAAIRQAIIESQLSMYPYGDSHLLRQFSLKTTEEDAKSLVKQRLEHNVLSPSGDKLPRSPQTTVTGQKASVFNYKPLIRRVGFSTDDNTTTVNNGNDSTNVSKEISHFEIPKPNILSASIGSVSRTRDNPKHFDKSLLTSTPVGSPLTSRITSREASNVPSSPLHDRSQMSDGAIPQPNFDLTINSPKNGHETSNGNISSPKKNDSDTCVKGPCGVICSKRYIYTEPSVEELHNFVQDGKVHLIDGFVIGRLGFGRIEWPGEISFADIDLGEVVKFHRKEVIVYPDESKKPAVGVEFNKKAIVSLEGVFPYDKATKKEIRDPLSEEAQSFSRLLERKCTKMDCDFIDYDAENGIWQFRVRHFSRYGYFEDDDDDDVPPPPSLKRKAPARPLQPIHENTVEMDPIELNDVDPDDVAPPHRNLGFDDSRMSLARVDPKSLFVSDTSMDMRSVRIGLTDDIMDFIDLETTREAPIEAAKYPMRTKVRTIKRFELSNELMSNPSLQQLLRPYMSPLSRRVGFGPSSNVSVTALLDPSIHSTDVFVQKIKLVPTIEAYLTNYLNSLERSADFERLIKTDALNMSPPSDFVKLIDSYLFDVLRVEQPLDVIDGKMNAFCEAICQDLNDSRFALLQRVAFQKWLRNELKTELEKKVESLKGKTASPYAPIYYCLIYGNFEKAIEIATEEKLFQITLLLGFFIAGTAVPKRIVEQSRKMFENMGQNSDMFRRRVYAILGHLLTFHFNGQTVNIMDNATLPQLLAIQLCLFATTNSTIHQNMLEVRKISAHLTAQ